MSAKPYELRRNNTSRVPCLRLRRRRGLLFVEFAAWVSAPGGKRKRVGNSFSADRAPVQATKRAMRQLERAVGLPYGLTPRQAWFQLKASL